MKGCIRDCTQQHMLGSHEVKQATNSSAEGEEEAGPRLSVYVLDGAKRRTIWRDLRSFAMTLENKYLQQKDSKLTH